MCLAVPGKITQIDDQLMAQVDYGSMLRPVSLKFTPEARVGDWVLVHAGFAIHLVDEEEARETLSLFEEILDYAGFD